MQVVAAVAATQGTVAPAALVTSSREVPAR